MTTLESVDRQHEKARSHRVMNRGNGSFRVLSSSSQTYYDVEISGYDVRRCTCPNGTARKSPTCTHVLAAAIFIAERRGYVVQPVPRGFLETEPDHKHFSVSRNTVLLARKRGNGEPFSYQIKELTEPEFVGQV